MHPPAESGKPNGLPLRRRPPAPSALLLLVQRGRERESCWRSRGCTHARPSKRGGGGGKVVNRRQEASEGGRRNDGRLSCLVLPRREVEQSVSQSVSQSALKMPPLLESVIDATTLSSLSSPPPPSVPPCCLSVSNTILLVPSAADADGRTDLVFGIETLLESARARISRRRRAES